MENHNQFKKHNYLNLETYRKNGEGVRTPVWFVEYENSLFVITLKDSWKVKRIRRSRTVRVAACRINGRVIGQWQRASAQEIDDDYVIEKIDHLYRIKYGFLNTLYEKQRVKNGSQRTILEIKLET